MGKWYDEEDGLKRKFMETFSGIHASEELKSYTLSQMHGGAESKTLKQENRLMPLRKKLCFLLPAVTLLSVVLIMGFWVRQSGTPYITDMEQGEFYEEVLLKNGKIRFVANRVAISITPNLGGITIGEASDENVYEVMEEKETDSGGKLVCRRGASIVLPDLGEKDWSYIEEQEIYVTMLNAEEIRYQAVFEKDGQVYELIGTNVSQREFIDYLYQVIK